MTSTLATRNHRTTIAAGLTLASLFVASGCSLPEHEDSGVVCMSTNASGNAYILVVEASSDDCAADHKGAELECTIEQGDDSTIRVSTRYQEGRDPDGGCAGPLLAQCELMVEEGTFDVRFGDSHTTIDIPAQETRCLPEGEAPVEDV